MKNLLAILALGFGIAAHASMEVRSTWTCNIRCNQGGGGYLGVSVVATGGRFAPGEFQLQALSKLYCSEQDGVKDIECDFNSGKLKFETADEYTVPSPYQSGVPDKQAPTMYTIGQ